MTDFRFPPGAGGGGGDPVVVPGPEEFDDVLNAFSASHDHSWKSGSDPDASDVLDEIGGSLKLNRTGTAFFGQPLNLTDLDPYEMYADGASSNRFVTDAGVDASADYSLSFWSRQQQVDPGGFPFFAEIYKSTSIFHTLMRRIDTPYQNLYLRSLGTTIYTQDKIYLGNSERKLLVMTREGLTCSLYINGLLVAQGDESGLTVMNGAVLYIGGYHAGVDDHDTFYGQVNYWSAALSVEAITSLWNGGHGRYYVAA